jgi:hypothetical protein
MISWKCLNKECQWEGKVPQVEETHTSFGVEFGENEYCPSCQGEIKFVGEGEVGEWWVNYGHQRDREIALGIGVEDLVSNEDSGYGFDVEGMRRCTKCERTQPMDNYCNDKKGPMGKSRRCRGVHPCIISSTTRH